MRRQGLSLTLQVLLWAVGNTLAGTATGLALGLFQGSGFEPRFLLISILFGNVVGFTVWVTSLTLFPRLYGVKLWTRAALLGVALLSGSAAGTALVFYLFPLFVLRDLRQSIAVVVINAVLALIVGSVTFVYEGLRSRLSESLREVEEVRLVESRLREEAARAQLAALQARIHPHFFFNTLNTIQALVAEDARRAEEVVQKLADLFRYTFKAADNRSVPLSEELDFIEGYLAIEKARFGERLRVEWAIAPDVRSARIPGRLLQPLVENAGIHGIAPLSEGGRIWIGARREATSLSVEVVDDGAGLHGEPDSLFRDGHGLANVKGRLDALCGGAGVVEIVPAPGGRGALARVRIPIAVTGLEVHPEPREAHSR